MVAFSALTFSGCNAFNANSPCGQRSLLLREYTSTTVSARLRIIIRWLFKCCAEVLLTLRREEVSDIDRVF